MKWSFKQEFCAAVREKESFSARVFPNHTPEKKVLRQALWQAQCVIVQIVDAFLSEAIRYKMRNH